MSDSRRARMGGGEPQRHLPGERSAAGALNGVGGRSGGIAGRNGAPALPGGGPWLGGSLLWRVAVLSVALVFFQIGVVSEVPLLGVSADLSPLLVAFVGLMCGSLPGAVTGFCVGLLVDLALVQTLGVTSLVFTVVGYWAGRLRELRDPQAALTPLLVGAAAAATATVGYSLIEFLLGVDAPVSFELLRQIVVGVAVDTIAALPVWVLVRRALVGGLPQDPRRRRRRAYTTGGLSPLSRGASGGGR